MPRPKSIAYGLPPRASGFTLLELVVVVFIFLFLFAMFYSPPCRARESAKRVNCAGNLKQIGLALLMYTGDNFSGYFPIHGEPGSRNFEPLNSMDTLASGKVYSCPSASITQTAAIDSNYLYVGSGLKDDNDFATDIRIAFDASGNHPKNQWMNALIIDGHAEGRRPDGTRGWNTYTNPTSPDPAGIVPPAPSAITTSPIASPDAAVTFPATP